MKFEKEPETTSLQRLNRTFQEKTKIFKLTDAEKNCNLCTQSIKENGASPLIGVCNKCIKRFGYNGFDEQGKLKQVNENKTRYTRK